VKELKETLREKNIRIRELEKLVPQKKKDSAAVSEVSAASDEATTIKNLREENEQLKKALAMAANESIAVGARKADSKPTATAATRSPAAERKESGGTEQPQFKAEDK
jgi:arginine deiminase